MAREKNENARPPGGIIADDVGMGKTFITAGLLRASQCWPALVIVPKCTLMQWASVLRTILPPGFPIVVMLTPKHVQLAASGDVKLVVAGHSCFQVADSPPTALMERVWGRVVVDEAHVARNPGTLLHRRLCGLNATAKWALTATPLQNSVRDLLALAAIVGLSNVKDPALVRDHYMLRRVNATAPESADPASVSASASASASTLPPLCVEDVLLDLGPVERAMYDKVCAEWSSELKKQTKTKGTECSEGNEGSEGNEDNDGFNGINGINFQHQRHRQMQALLHCRQACTHPALYHNSVARRTADTGETMVDRKGVTRLVSVVHMRLANEAILRGPAASARFAFLCADIARHAPRHRCLVFCDWAEEMALLAGALEQQGVRTGVYDGKLSVSQREDLLHMFQGEDGELRALLVQIQCGACGLNLQMASRVYLMRPQWNPATELQAIGRAHRSGQQERVTVLRLVARKTVDELSMRRQRDKLGAITEVLKENSMQQRLHPHYSHSASASASALHQEEEEEEGIN